MAIIIDSKLTDNQRARLIRAARQNWDEANAGYELGFAKDTERRNRYFALIADVDEHYVARHMMAVAGRTFDYHLES